MTLSQRLFNDFDRASSQMIRYNRLRRKSPANMTSLFDRLATREHGDWRLLLRTGANCLVTAAAPLLDEFDSASRSVLAEPIARLCGTRPLNLVASKTLVIANVHRLSGSDQRTLKTWMDDPANAHTQVVTLTSVSLFALVEGGSFDADLFYRLNAIHLQLSHADATH